MPTDADRPAIVEPRVATGPGAAHQEVALAFAQDIWDHLLERRVDLHRRPWLEPSLGPTVARNASTPCRPDARPAWSVDHRRAGDDEDELILRGRHRPPPRRSRASRWRAAASRRAMRSASGPSARSRSASHGESRTSQSSRSRAAIAGAFVAIPVPIATSPRARRVTPPTRSPRFRGLVPLRPVGTAHLAGHRLNERRGEDERKMADRGDGRVGGRPPSSRPAYRRRPPRGPPLARGRPASRSPRRRPTAGR